MGAGSGEEEMLTTQGVFCHAQTQRLQSGIDLQIRPRDRTVCGTKQSGRVKDWTGVDSRARKAKDRMGWHWEKDRRYKREREGERETEHLRQAHTRTEGVVMDRDRRGCVTQQAEVARAEACPTE